MVSLVNNEVEGFCQSGVKRMIFFRSSQLLSIFIELFMKGNLSVYRLRGFLLSIQMVVVLTVVTTQIIGNKWLKNQVLCRPSVCLKYQ